MKEYLGDKNEDPYGFTYKKNQLRQHFGKEIVITEINDKANVVTLRSTTANYLMISTSKQKTRTLILTN